MGSFSPQFKKTTNMKLITSLNIPSKKTLTQLVKTSQKHALSISYIVFVTFPH